MSQLLIALQSGMIKAVTPNLASRFEDDMIVLEKWKPKAYDFLDVNNDYTTRYRQRSEKIIRVIELCNESQIEYDNYKARINGIEV